MTTQTTYCDKCRRVVAHDRTEMLVECGPMRPSRESVDLCAECCRAFVAWLSAPALAHPPAGATGHAPPHPGGAA